MFTATKWSTVEDKSKFVIQFKKFVLSEFDIIRFPKWFYTRLSMMFGMIAHYNQGGFFAEYFMTPQDQQRFITECKTWPCYGDPAWTYSDVERHLQSWLKEPHVLPR